MWSRARPALSTLCPPPPSLASAPRKPVPAIAAWCLPTHLSAQGPLDEGELLGHQQDPVGACSCRMLHLEVSKVKDREDGVVTTTTHPPGSSEMPLTQSSPGPPRFPACLPHQSPLGQEGTTEHCPSEPLGPAQGWWTPGLMCLLVPSLGVSNSPGGRGLSLLDVAEVQGAQRTSDPGMIVCKAEELWGHPDQALNAQVCRLSFRKDGVLSEVRASSSGL